MLISRPEARLVGELAVLVHSSREQMAEVAALDVAAIVRSAVAERGGASVMFATGNSQLAFLDALAVQPVDWSAVTAFHMDEYVGLDSTHPASFARYIRERVEERLRPGAVHYLRGAADDAAVEAARYASLLAEHPLDLVIAGIGENGHLAFNDPPVADFEDPLAVKVVELEERSRRQQVGEGHFPTIDDVPRTAMTVTMSGIHAARHVVVVVPESRKADAVHAALEGPISTACPASVLRRWSHATLYLDADSSARFGAG